MVWFRLGSVCVLCLLCCLVVACPAPSEPGQELGPVPDASAPDTRASGPDTPASDTPAVTPDTGTTEDPALKQIDAFIAKQNVDTSNSSWRVSLALPPKLTFSAQHNYFWVLETSKGTMKIQFFTDVAPMHVSSTIYLTRLGFYDTLTFHRVITGFMAQGGDPLGNGRGGPGYKYQGEFAASAKHSKAGILSMAHAGPGTDGSQFFITFKATPHLDGVHTVFGEVVEGMQTLSALEAAGSSSGAPSERLVITKARIEVQAKN